MYYGRLVQYQIFITAKMTKAPLMGLLPFGQAWLSHRACIFILKRSKSLFKKANVVFFNYD